MNRSAILSLLATWLAAANPAGGRSIIPDRRRALHKPLARPRKATLENDAIAMRWTFADGRLKPDRLSHKQSSTSLSLAGKECFSFALAQTPDPRTRKLTASDLKLAAPPEIKRLQPEPGSVRLGDRFGGWELSARLVSTAPSFEVLWRAELRDGPTTSARRC